MAENTLEKLMIIAFKSPDYSEQEPDPFVAMVNPETYTLDYKVECQDGAKQGSSTAQQIFTAKKPEDFNFELLLDGTGLIDATKKGSIEPEIAKLRDLLLKFEGDIHEPKHVKVIWGDLCFKGRCTGLSINIKLFNPGGQAIRALWPKILGMPR
jgi:hypothetical protein